jgi:intracellular sulfur oxidation DsrE/DsrF family protein
MPLSRKRFVAAAALGASAAAIAPTTIAAAADEPMQAHFHILRPNEFDHRSLQDTLMVRKAHKQVFQASSSILLVPGIASAYIHMQNSLNAHEFSFGFGRGSLATLGVFMGPAIVLGLNDAMWSKYGIGDAFKLAPTNVYYKAKSLKFTDSPDDLDAIYQDWSAQAVMHRGGKFVLCHNAMTFIAGLLAQKNGASPAALLADFEKNLMPGFEIVPAGVATVQLAQQHGYTLFPLG